MIRPYSWFGIIFSLSLIISCTSSEKEKSIKINGYDLMVNGDTVQVNNFVWSAIGYKNYPFTTYGDIACSANAVYFYPEDTLGKDIAGIPLNQIAKTIIISNGWEKEVPYNKLTYSSDLKEAINLGLEVCKFNLTQISENK